MYAEDLDLCYKVMRAGYMNYFLPEGRIIHLGGKSSNPTRAIVMKWKSILHYIAKHRGSAYQFLFRVAMACSAIIRLACMTLWLGARGKLRNEARSGRLMKWWLVLKTMATVSGKTPPARPVSTIGQAGGGTVVSNDEEACLRRG
jgi:GT2 family glycosyltransferase